MLASTSFLNTPIAAVAMRKTTPQNTRNWAIVVMPLLYRAVKRMYPTQNPAVNPTD